MEREQKTTGGTIESALGYLEHSKLPVAVFQVSDGIVDVKIVSDGLVRMCGDNLSADQVKMAMKENLYAFVHPGDRDLVMQATADFMAEKSEYDIMFRVKGQNFYDERSVHGVGYHEYLEDGSRYAIVTYENITSYIRSERENTNRVRESLNSLINNDDYAIAIIGDVTHELLLYNPAMEEAIPPANFFTTGMTFEEYFYGSNDKRNNLFEVFADKGDKLYVDPYTGTEMAVRITSTNWNGRKAFYFKGSMTSETYYDSLTTLPNKRFYMERGNVLFRQYLAQGLRPHILYMNMKSLHYYNNAFGFEDGNRLLIGMAMVLKKSFPGQLVSRFAADHFFILLSDKPDMGLISDIAEEIRDLGQMAVEVKFGLAEISEESQDLTECTDFAKIACESIKESLDIVCAEYSDKMNENTILKKYVIENIDRAVGRGFIRVYYQPVVRTLTGKVCGAEALARWVDPVKGVLNVGTVISALEESHQIHKLDCCIIEQVCREYRECVDEGRTPVPVSVNLSRLDFVCCDIFSSIEKSRRKYSVPRNMINLEITESVFGSESSIRSVVERFRTAGYQVWMDDFGSGYSSLNLLKEFSFDEVKLDMEFLSNFSEKGKAIIKSTIDMAKDIGIYTLAEGVETVEQFEFLKFIGCEKVQGFLFERPLPYDKLIESCERNNLEIEEPIWREYYDEIGKTSFQSDKPVALVEYEENEFKVLFSNYPFKDYLSGISDNEDIFTQLINDEQSPLHKSFKSSVDKQICTGASFALTFLENNHYISLSSKCIAKCAGRYVFNVCIDNISDNEFGDANRYTDDVIRNLYYLFDCVSIINSDEDTAEEIFADQAFKVSSHNIIENYSEYLESFGKKYVHPDDLGRFTVFSRVSDIRNRLFNEGESVISEHFRICTGDGRYSWKLFSFFRMPGSSNNRIISCMREVPENKFESGV